MKQSAVKLHRRVVALLTGLVALATWLNKRPSETSSPADMNTSDWKAVLLGTKNAFSVKSLGVLAAGIAYFATLSFFPLIVAAVAIASVIMTEAQITNVVSGLDQYLPADVASLVSTQLQVAFESGSGNLIVATVSLALSLFSVSSATHNAIAAANIAYNVKEDRGFVRLRMLSLGLTAGIILMGILVLPLIVISPSTLVGLGVPETIANLLVWLRWPLLVGLIMLVLAVFYRYGPNRQNPPWQWVSWGAVTATLIWLIGTVLFFVYVQNFANYSDTYSLFAGIIVMMIWLNVSALALLLGAEVNSQLEAKSHRQPVS